MTSYERLFGTGPRGIFISLLLLAIPVSIEKTATLPGITSSDILRYSIFGVLSTVTILMLLWSIKSLPLSDRGNKLVTAGAFRYFRHPLYGAFLTFFNFGFAIFLNNWVYIIWAIALHPVWHWNIKGEERLMEQAFPSDYIEYSKKTGRFIPRILGRHT